jgi:hypothetical protein
LKEPALEAGFSLANRQRNRNLGSTVTGREPANGSTKLALNQGANNLRAKTNANLAVFQTNPVV